MCCGTARLARTTPQMAGQMSEITHADGSSAHKYGGGIGINGGSSLVEMSLSTYTKVFSKAVRQAIVLPKVFTQNFTVSTETGN